MNALSPPTTPRNVKQGFKKMLINYARETIRGYNINRVLGTEPPEISEEENSIPIEAQDLP